MCFVDDSYHDWQQFVWALRRARKDYPCEACDTGIHRGELYRYSKGLFERESFHVQRRCLRCDTIALGMQKRGCEVYFDLSGMDGEGSRIEDEYVGEHVLDTEPVAAFAFMTQAELEAHAKG